MTRFGFLVYFQLLDSLRNLGFLSHFDSLIDIRFLSVHNSLWIFGLLPVNDSLNRNRLLQLLDSLWSFGFLNLRNYRVQGLLPTPCTILLNFNTTLLL